MDIAWLTLFLLLSLFLLAFCIADVFFKREGGGGRLQWFHSDNDLKRHDSASTKAPRSDLHNDTCSRRALKVHEHGFYFRTNLGVEKRRRNWGPEDEPINLSTNLSEHPLEVKRTHFIMDSTRGDSAPFILEEYKLAFFTIPKVGCTVFKQLFRRMEGYEDWDIREKGGLPHDTKRNGLKRLSQFSSERVLEILTSPEWTRAIFVREPKDRVLSATR